MASKIIQKVGSLPLPNYLEMNCRMQEIRLPKGFELISTYGKHGLLAAPRDPDEEKIDPEATVCAIDIKKGYVLIGRKVYETEPVRYKDLISAGTNSVAPGMTVYLVAKKTKRKKSSDPYTWKVDLKKNNAEIDIDTDEEMQDSFSFPLFKTKRGVLVEDNRYLLCLSRKSQILRVTEKPTSGEDIGGGGNFDPENTCPVYKRLYGLIETLTRYNQMADDFLDQFKE